RYPNILRRSARRWREVALPGIVDHGDDRSEIGMSPRQLERGGHVAAARDPAEDPFLRRKAARRLDAFLGGRGDDAAQEAHVEVPRHEAITDALDAVVAPFASSEERALRRLDRVELDARILLPQVAADAGQRAAAPLRVDERAYGAVRLLPDLGPGGLKVRFDVVGIVELSGHPESRRVA